MSTTLVANASETSPSVSHRYETLGGTGSYRASDGDPWLSTILSNSWLGAATTPKKCGLRYGGCGQSFQNGFVYSSPAAGLFAIRPEIGKIWAYLGYEQGVLGYPTTALSLRAGTYTQSFQGGTVAIINGRGVVTSATIPSPKVSGGPRLGMTLQASVPSSVKSNGLTIEWYYQDSSQVLAQGASYELKSADVGKRIAARLVFAQNGQTKLASPQTAMAIPAANALTASGAKQSFTSYKQRDSRWSNTQVGLATMGWTACVPTAFAMTLSAYGLQQDPVQVATVMNRIGDYNRTIPGAGAFSIFAAAKYYGVRAQPIRTASELEVALKQNRAVIAQVSGPINVTAPGTTHAVVLTGWNNGKTLVKNPGRFNDAWFSVSQLWGLRSTLAFDSYNGAVFWVVG